MVLYERNIVMDCLSLKWGSVGWRDDGLIKY